MKINQKDKSGFALIELLILLIVATVIAGGAYYVGKNHSTIKSVATTTSSQSTSKNISLKPGWHLYTDSKAGFSLQLPQGWSYKKGQVSKLDDGTVNKDYQGNPIINPDSIMPDSENDQSTNGISEVVSDTTTLTPKAYFQDNGYGRATYNGRGSDDNINGYSAYTAVVSSPGGDASVPVIVHNGKAVQFFYYSADSMNKNAALCAQIVDTIKFL
jgi:hypothetical protein